MENSKYRWLSFLNLKAKKVDGNKHEICRDELEQVKLDKQAQSDHFLQSFAQHQSIGTSFFAPNSISTILHDTDRDFRI